MCTFENRKVRQLLLVRVLRIIALVLCWSRICLSLFHSLFLCVFDRTPLTAVCCLLSVYIAGNLCLCTEILYTHFLGLICLSAQCFETVAIYYITQLACLFPPLSVYPSSGKVTDLISFYELPSSVIGNQKHKEDKVRSSELCPNINKGKIRKAASSVNTNETIHSNDVP